MNEIILYISDSSLSSDDEDMKTLLTLLNDWIAQEKSGIQIKLHLRTTLQFSKVIA